MQLCRMPKLRSLTKLCLQMAIILGNFLTAIGFLLLALGAVNIFDMDVLAFGLSSGVRIVGSIAITGCLLSAFGYGIDEYLTKKL
jgi:hypothetical protein